MKARAQRLASIIGLSLGCLGLLSLLVGAISNTPCLIANGVSSVPPNFECHVTYPQGSFVPISVSAPEAVALFVVSVVLVVASSISLFYSFVRRPDSPRKLINP